MRDEVEVKRVVQVGWDQRLEEDVRLLAGGALGDPADPHNSARYYGTVIGSAGVPAGAYEVHQYLDADSSGTSATCASATIGSQRLQAFTGWLKQNGKRGFLGETAGGQNSTCYAALDDLLAHIDNNLDVWMGWTYWSAGPWWGDYMYSLEPSNGQDRPQMAVLAKHLAQSQHVLLPLISR